MSYAFLSIKEISKIRKFLNDNWKKNHILVINKKLLRWQHEYKKQLNFFCLKKNNKIISALGIINQQQDNSFSKQGMGIVCSKNKIGVLSLLINFMKRKYKILIAIGLTKEIKPIYKHLNFITGKLNIYYIANIEIKNNFISKNLKKTKIRFYNLNNIKVLDNSNLKKKFKSYEYKYISWRFVNHPIYNYNFLTSDDFKLKIIYREVKIKSFKIMRIVDFYGSFKNQKNFTKKLLKFCIDKKYNHIEMMHYGDEDKFIKKTLFQKKNDYQKIPINVEPFDNLKKKNIYFAYK